MKNGPDSSAHGKIVKFVLDNPNSIDTPRGVAAWTNVSIADTRRILEELTKKGVLKAFRTSSTIAYSLSEKKKAEKLI